MSTKSTDSKTRVTARKRKAAEIDTVKGDKLDLVLDVIPDFVCASVVADYLAVDPINLEKAEFNLRDHCLESYLWCKQIAYSYLRENNPERACEYFKKAAEYRSWADQ